MSEFGVSVFYEPDNGEPSGDVIFMHGLDGDALGTWTNNDGQCWLKGISQSMPQLRILTVNHPSNKFAEVFSGGGMDLMDRSYATLELLKTYDVGERPLIFVTHSLGGLITKALLRKAHDKGGAENDAFLSHVVGVVFLATPHEGSGLASVLSLLPGFPSNIVEDLKKNSKQLNELKDWYVSRANEREIATQAFSENKNTSGAMIVVSAQSAHPGTADGSPIPVDANHIDICKFEDDSNPTFRMIERFIKKNFQRFEIDLTGTVQRDDLDQYTQKTDGDRKTLEEKLIEGGREHEVNDALVAKENIMMYMRRNIISSSEKQSNRIFLGDIVSRFKLAVLPEIHKNADHSIVNSKIQEAIIDKLSDKKHGLANQADIHSSIYYLTGNCHISWGDYEND